MSNLNLQEIREMTDEQLINAIDDNRETMYKLRFNQATGELKDLNELRRNKRELARLKTVLTERQRAAK
jgi:large subunit ribosomal protein L29